MSARAKGCVPQSLSFVPFPNFCISHENPRRPRRLFDSSIVLISGVDHAVDPRGDCPFAEFAGHSSPLAVTGNMDDGVNDGAGRGGDQVRQVVEIDPKLCAQRRQNDKETDQD